MHDYDQEDKYLCCPLRNPTSQADDSAGSEDVVTVSFCGSSSITSTMIGEEESLCFILIDSLLASRTSSTGVPEIWQLFPSLTAWGWRSLICASRSVTSLFNRSIWLTRRFRTFSVVSAVSFACSFRPC